VIVLSFLTTTLIVHRTSSEVDSLSENIVNSSMPRIERLAALRASALQVEVALASYIRSSDPTTTRGFARSREDLALKVENLISVPTPADEVPLWRTFQGSLVRYQEAVERARQLALAGDRRAAETSLHAVVAPASTAVVDAAMREIEFNARRGRDLAAQIQETRRRTIGLSYGLTALCMGLGVAGLVLIRRQARRRRALVDAHARYQEERADEYEQFAGRVAHDIRGPLGVVMTASEVIAQVSTDEMVGKMVVRIQRGLARAADITEGLLGFARAGARPDPGARTDVRATIDDLVNGARPEAEVAAVELHVEAVPSVLVRCSTGVYLSLVGNLIRNAIKYMGSSTERRVTVKVTDDGQTVRTEVSDTGPGISEADFPVLFDPYFRGSTKGPAGLGLGLATVRRLAEGHEGRAGVGSAAGGGTRIWFELPRAGSAPSSATVDDTAAGVPQALQRGRFEAVRCEPVVARVQTPPAPGNGANRSSRPPPDAS
jgi:signal transduction histidine kinase